MACLPQDGLAATGRFGQAKQNFPTCQRALAPDSVDSEMAKHCIHCKNLFCIHGEKIKQTLTDLQRYQACLPQDGLPAAGRFGCHRTVWPGETKPCDLSACFAPDSVDSEMAKHESRITNHKSRITNHESRITSHKSQITNHKITILSCESGKLHKENSSFYHLFLGISKSMAP
jgi:hypothetical protein